MRARCARGAAGTPQGSPARKQDQPRRSGQAQTQSRPCRPSRELSISRTVSSPRINSDPYRARSPHSGGPPWRIERVELKKVVTPKGRRGRHGKLPGGPHRGFAREKLYWYRRSTCTTIGVFIAQLKLHHDVYSRQNLETVECFWPACGCG